MALTGRVALAGLFGAAAVLVAAALTPAAATALLVLLAFDGALLACVVADIVLAAKVRPLRMARSGDTLVRLGETATVTLTIENPGRRMRGDLRDAWPPSAGARPRRAPIDIRTRRPVPHQHHAHAGAARRQEGSGGDGAIVRAAASRRPAGQTRGALDRPGHPAVRQPPSPAGKTRAAARTRWPAPVAAARSGQ